MLLLALPPHAGAQRPVVPATTAAPSTTAPAAAPGDTLRLTLAQSVATALARSTPVLTAQEDERVAAASVLRAYGQFLPTLAGIGSTYSEAGNPLLSSTALLPTNATLYGLNVGLSTTYTLFSGTRDRAALRTAIAQREAAGLTLGRAREEIAYDVANAYYQVVLDDRLAAVARTTLQLSRNREAQLTAQVRAGMKAPPDLYRQQAQTRADEAAVIAADNRGDADRITLLRRLRYDPARPLAVTLPAAAPDGTPALFVPDAPNAATGARTGATPGMQAPATTPPIATGADVAALERQALIARPDLAAAAAQRRAADQQMRFARGERLPTIGIEFDLVDQARLFGRAVQNGQNLLAPGQRGAFSQLGSQVAGLLSLGVNLPIFDRHQARADEERAQALEERSRVTEADVRDRIVGEVAQAAADIRAADLTAQAAAAQVDAAERAFAAVSGRYEVGMASFIDVATAQTALAQARVQREQATVNQSLARARLGLATGRGVVGATAP
ncbi:MAG TPA: TolC family protein [Gemmatirosa sp.]